jgi:hypothetical protein
VCSVSAAIHPLGFIGSKLPTPLHVLLEPASGIGRIVGGDAQLLIDPSKAIGRLAGEDDDKPKAPARRESKREDIFDTSRDPVHVANERRNAQQRKAKKQAELSLLATADGRDPLNDAPDPGRPIGSQKLDSVLLRGKKSILGGAP